jgi:hypothetical protein
MPASDLPTYSARTRTGKRSKTYPAGRCCSECETVLSIYNPLTTCSLHTPRRAPRLRGHQRKVPAQ